MKPRKNFDISGVTIVGFINEFNSKGSYPEFAIKPEAKVIKMERKFTPVKEAMTTEGAINRMEKAAVKRAKKAFNRANPDHKFKSSTKIW